MIDPIDMQDLKAYAAPNPVSEVTKQLYEEYAKLWGKTQFNRRIDRGILPLFVLLPQIMGEKDEPAQKPEQKPEQAATVERKRVPLETRRLKREELPT